MAILTCINLSITAELKVIQTPLKFRNGRDPGTFRFVGSKGHDCMRQKETINSNFARGRTAQNDA